MNTTFIILKPDAVARGLVGKILSMIEREGLRIVAAKMVTMSDRMVKRMYKEHEGRPYYNSMVKFIQSGPCLPMIIYGNNAQEKLAKMRGGTKVHERAANTIRGKYAGNETYNVIHVTDDQESFRREIRIFFRTSDIHKINFRFDYLNKRGN